jgi:hypothetical protein
MWIIILIIFCVLIACSFDNEEQTRSLQKSSAINGLEMEMFKVDEEKANN